MAANAEQDQVTLHASCVALGPSGLLITGASGSGKSGLALMLMAYGARLVADDATLVRAEKDGLWAGCPASIRGRIEARGIGILAAESQARTRLVAAVDLDRTETERLPPERSVTISGHNLPLILNGPGLPFAAALIQYLKGRSLNDMRTS